jgi:hypothetical protein
MNQDDTATESILLTVTIDAKEARGTVAVKIPNTFVQIELEIKQEKICKKLREICFDMLIEINKVLQ